MVSSGPELRVLGGRYGSEGHFSLIPGYSAVGEVISVGDEAMGFCVRDMVSGCNPNAVPGVGYYWGSVFTYSNPMTGSIRFCLPRMPSLSTTLSSRSLPSACVAWKRRRYGPANRPLGWGHFRPQCRRDGY